jgi:hypothetical protein
MLVPRLRAQRVQGVSRESRMGGKGDALGFDFVVYERV